MKFLAYLILIMALMMNTLQTLAAQEKDIIRVGLSNSSFSTFEFSDVTIVTENTASLTDMYSGAQIKDIEGNTEISAQMKDREFFISVNGKEVLKNAKGPVVIISKGKLGVKNLNRKGNPALYRGIIELKAAVPKSKSKFNIINVLDLQTYLKGVVPNEMPVSFGLNALKAQAVAARNYANRPQNTYKNYDICDSTACQVYYGANSENPLSDRAVDETEGIFALYGEGSAKEPVLALYSSTGGGITEDYEHVYGSGNLLKPSKPYLKSVKDNNSVKFPRSEKEVREFYTNNVPSFDMKSPKHRWKVTFDRFELEDTLNKTLREQSLKGLTYPAFEPDDCVWGVEDIRVVKRGTSGKVLEVEIRSMGGNWRVKKELGIRRVLKKGNAMLPSGNFAVEKTVQKSPEKIDEESGENKRNTGVDAQNDGSGKVLENKTDENGRSGAIFTFKKPENQDGTISNAEKEECTKYKKVYKNSLGMLLPDSFTLFGAGFGHGVGMSQYGAGYLSARGVGYDIILKHYYTGITLGTMKREVSYNNYNQNFVQSIYVDNVNTGTAGVLPSTVSKEPLKDEVTALYNASKARAKYILNIDYSKRPSKLEFYINGNHFAPDTKGFYGKILKTDITKYLKKGKNTITFMPLSAADKDKTAAFWVEIEK